MTCRPPSFCLALLVAFAQSAGAVNVDFESGPFPDFNSGAFGRGSPPEETIDLAAKQAEVIVRGAAISIERLDLLSAVENRSEPLSVLYAEPVVQVSLRVSEVLKGPRIDTCVFRAKLDELNAACGEWVHHGGRTEALFFLVPPAREGWPTAALGSGAVPFVVKERGVGLWAFSLPPTDKSSRLPIDVLGVRHRMAHDLLATVQEAVQAKVVSPDLIAFHVSGYAPDYQAVAPVTSRLEVQARRWVRAKDQLETALRVLSYFPSDENADLLIPLLNDTRLASAPQDKWDVRTYSVRKGAYAVLRRWGRDVQAPLTEELASYTPLHRSRTACGVATALLLLAVLPLVCRRLLAAAAALCIGALVLVVAALIVRSQKVHELVMSVGGSSYELGSYPNGLHLVRIEDWPMRAPLSYGRCDAWSTTWDPLTFRTATEVRTFKIRTSTGTKFCRTANATYPFEELVVPHWLALLASAMVPTAWFISLLRSGPRRRAARIAKGLCGECGYDVRASEGRCPECGRRIRPPLGAVNSHGSHS